MLTLTLENELYKEKNQLFAEQSQLQERVVTSSDDIVKGAEYLRKICTYYEEHP